jgi:hypothetical protein
MMRIITSPNLLEDLSQLDPLLATEGWNTLMTFTRETGCKFFFCLQLLYFPCLMLASRSVDAVVVER